MASSAGSGRLHHGSRMALSSSLCAMAAIHPTISEPEHLITQFPGEEGGHAPRGPDPTRPVGARHPQIL